MRLITRDHVHIFWGSTADLHSYAACVVHSVEINVQFVLAKIFVNGLASALPVAVIVDNK